MNNGTILPTRPSMGSWMLYGLGTENESAGLRGPVSRSAGPVLDPVDQCVPAGRVPGTYINHSNLQPDKLIPYLTRDSGSADEQRRQLDLAEKLNRLHIERAVQTDGSTPAFERWKPLSGCRLPQRTRSTLNRNQRRLVRPTVPDILPTAVCWRDGSLSEASGSLRSLWQRSAVGHAQQSSRQRPETRQDIDTPSSPTAERSQTARNARRQLVIWGGEFADADLENGSGRDQSLRHDDVDGRRRHSRRHDVWRNWRPASGRCRNESTFTTCTPHPALPGFDHERLTYRYAGRDFRLTDIAGRVIHDVLETKSR